MLRRNQPFVPAAYIDHPAKLAPVLDALAQQPQIAVDTESNSLHAYHERVCLIQVSSREADYIIDPLAVRDLSGFGALLADPSIETVFHAAEYDLMCLKRDFHFEIANLFDTMVAARVCGIRQVGLNNLVRAFLDIELDKSHQRDNWGRRPLSVASLRYAQMDTHYLLDLRDLLAAQLEEQTHLEEARETFDDLSRMTPPHEGRSFDPEGFWRIGLPAHLTSQQMATLRALYLMRETLAERANMPPLNVVQNRTLLELALRQPCSREELKGIPGLSPNGIRRWGDAWLRAIRTSQPTLNAGPPSAEPPLPVDIQDRYTALHAWRKKRAEQRGVESDVIMTKQALWSLAYKDPACMEDLVNIEGLGPWRLQAYGAEILAVLQHFENEA